MADKQTPERLGTEEADILRAVELLRAGKLVAIPTETVYGLAARADSAEAVAGIYRAKGRPDFNPLIVHVPTLAAAHELARFDGRAEALAARYWPGPLTMVLPMRPDAAIARAVTAGLPTIALRMPDHPAMGAILRDACLPLAAPSANRSGGISPTTAEHVADSLGPAVDAIVDAGPCRRGVESTIIALRENGDWQLLRAGPVTMEELTALLGAPSPLREAAIEAPGQLARHYSPGKPVRLNAEAAESDEFLIGFGAIKGDCSLAEDGDPALAAARLYDCLHRAGSSGRPRIAVAPVPETGIGAAINDRLRRAAA